MGSQREGGFEELQSGAVKGEGGTMGGDGWRQEAFGDGFCEGLMERSILVRERRGEEERTGREGVLW